MGAVWVEFSKHIKELTYNCFVAPFKVRELVHIYAGTLLALIGFGLFDLYLVFFIAGKGLVPLLSFWLVRYGLSCFLLMPGGFMMLVRFGAKRTFYIALAMQLFAALGFCFYAGQALSGWAYGMIGAFVSAPFWMVYHALMIIHTHHDNRGNEVVMGDAGIKLGSIIGSVLGGIALAGEGTQYGMLALGFAVLCSVAGTFMLVRRLLNKGAAIILPSLERQYSIAQHIVQRPRRSLLTMLASGIDHFTFSQAPVWLMILGLSGLSVGVVNSLAIVLTLLVAPIAGALANRADGRVIASGGLLSLLGWMPWAVFSSPILLFGSYVAWSSGSQFMNLGLSCRWYEDRSLHAIAAREILLGLGRMMAIICMVPILYVSFQHFAWAAGLVCVLMCATALVRSRVGIVLKQEA